eukprot:1527596-Rhodomonas_salina.3
MGGRKRIRPVSMPARRNRSWRRMPAIAGRSSKQRMLLGTACRTPAHARTSAGSTRPSRPKLQKMMRSSGSPSSALGVGRSLG